jgi:hypothetical protein
MAEGGWRMLGRAVLGELENTVTRAAAHGVKSVVRDVERGATRFKRGLNRVIDRLEEMTVIEDERPPEDPLDRKDR